MLLFAILLLLCFFVVVVVYFGLYKTCYFAIPAILLEIRLVTA